MNAVERKVNSSTFDERDMIKVLVAEDSAVTRDYLVYLIGRDPDMQVVGTARDGAEALEQAERLKPNVVLMDVEMPRMNGYEAASQIMQRVPTPIVMISAGFSRDEVTMTFEALKAGALVAVAKPGGIDHPDHAEGARELLRSVKLMAEVKVVRRWPARQRPVPPATLAGATNRRIRLVALGASTGGPAVVSEILGALPGTLGVPVLLVQHIATGFTAGMAEWLAKQTRLGVTVASHGEATYPGRVYLAPTGLQMGITWDGRIRLSKEPAEDGFCPSVSYLFQSAAEAYGRSAMGVLLTGMGRDGATGLRRLREVGALTVAQDEATSVIFGMPGEAVRLGAAEYVLPPEHIAAMIRSLEL